MRHAMQASLAVPLSLVKHGLRRSLTNVWWGERTPSWEDGAIVGAGSLSSSCSPFTTVSCAMAFRSMSPGEVRTPAFSISLLPLRRTAHVEEGEKCDGLLFSAYSCSRRLRC